MYLGSVRFFKHLILFLFFSVIVALGVMVLITTGQNSAKEAEIETLKKQNAALGAVNDFYGGDNELSVEEYYDLMRNFNINPDGFLEYFYKNNPEKFEKAAQMFGIIKETETETETEAEIAETFPTVPLPVTTTAPPTVTTTVPETAETSEETMPAETEFYSEYMDMFPELNVSPDLSGGYISDADYVYLTFDDGPSVYTGSVLEILSKYDIKATFFVIPDDSENCKNYLSTMLGAGHSVGVHSMSHDYRKIYENVEAFLTDFNEAFNMIYEQTGYKPFLYRFPGGSINDYNSDTRNEIIAEMTRRGFIYYDWNVDSKDSSGATWTQMYDSVLNDIGDMKRSVVLFHDGPSRQNTVYVLEDIVLALTKSTRGYVFSAITENTRPEQH